MDMPKSNTLSVPARLFARGYVAWIYPPHQAPSTAQSLAKAASTTKAKANSPYFDMTMQEIEAKLADQEERIAYLEKQVGRVKRHVGFTHLPPPAG